MPNINELGTEYVSRLITASDTKREFDKILREINGLVYTDSQKPISNIDKAEIVENIIQQLEILFPRTPKRIFERTEIIKTFSNDSFIELIDYIKEKIKK